MMYSEGDKFLLAGIECRVGIVNAYNCAYVVAEQDGEIYNGKPIMAGMVFAVIDNKGRDSLGNHAVPLANTKCGAV